MTELIKINESTIGTETKQTVNARDLHKFLEIGKDFSNWMKDQIQRARLVENQDFIVFAEKGENLKGGRPSIEYYITIEAGKHIGMMSQSDKGFEIRDYFIECEKIALSKLMQPVDPLIQFAQSVLFANKLLKEKDALIELQNQQLIEQQPKVKFFDIVADSKDCIDFSQLAKLLGVKGLGRNKLMARLREDQILQKNNNPYQQYVDMGLFNVVESGFIKPDNSAHVYLKTTITQKGINYIINKYMKG